MGNNFRLTHGLVRYIGTVISSEVLRVSGNQEGPQNAELSLLFCCDRAADNLQLDLISVQSYKELKQMFT